MSAGAEDATMEAAVAEQDWASAMAEQSASASASASSAATSTPAPRQGESPAFQQLAPGGAAGARTHNDIDLILDIPVQLTVELGRTRIAIRNLLQLAQGSVVELDGLAGEPMDVLVNGCLIAQGEVVIVNDKFGIRLTDIITPGERIRKLNR
jgi:flagellar motor switch protein FliN